MKPQASDRQAGDCERPAIRKIEAGDVADFSGATEKPVIRAAALRAAALRAPPCGLRLSGARIEGGLDLSCLTLPALVLEGCDLPDAIDVSNARLGALSLDGSRFRRLSARGAVIDGPFDFSDTAPFEDAAFIDAGKARIRGGVTGFRARLRMPPTRPREQVKMWDHVYALRLSEADIGGNVWLADGFTAEGGVCLDDTHVAGSFSLSNGARITASESDKLHPGDAFHAYHFRCDGMCGMNFGLQSEGRIFIAFSTFGSRIHLDGTFRKSAETYDFKGRRLNTSAALMIDDCEIGANVAVTADTAIDGSVSLSRCRIGGNVSFAGNSFANIASVCTAIANKSDDGQSPALVMDQSEIHRDLLFGHRFSAQGRVSLARVRIGGDLDATGAQFDNGNGVALDLRRASADEIRPDPKSIETRGRVEYGGLTVGRRTT